MATQKIYTGIDIGSNHVRVVVARAPERSENAMPIIATGTANSRGLHHGYIISAKDAARSIAEAVASASTAAGVPIKRARIAVGGVGLDEIRSTGEIAIGYTERTQNARGTTRAVQVPGEITETDVERAILESEKRAAQFLVNRKVVQAIPLSYRIDGQPVLGRPIHMRGSKLSVDTLLITALEQHLNDLIEVVESAGVEVEDVLPAPLAASLALLTKPQKMAGSLLANIGAETLSIAVFENDTPISIKVFPIGGADITNDIALSLQVPLKEAEQMKKGAITKVDQSRKRVEDLVAARLKDMFNLIDAHLKSIGKQRLLPAGIVITGGGSGIASARDLAKAVLRLPSQIGVLPSHVRTLDATWAVAYGLCRWAYITDDRRTLPTTELGGVLSELWANIKSVIKGFLP